MKKSINAAPAILPRMLSSLVFRISEIVLVVLTLSLSPRAAALTPDPGDNVALAPADTINLLSAASRLTHGATGTFDVDMPLNGELGVESRREGVYNAVFTFDAPVFSGEVVVIGGTAFVAAISFSGNSMTAQLKGVTSAEIVTLRVRNINGDGERHGEVPFGFLIGDVNGDRVVNRFDLDIIRWDQGQMVNGDNFRVDMNLDEQIDAVEFHIWERTLYHNIL